MKGHNFWCPLHIFHNNITNKMKIIQMPKYLHFWSHYCTEVLIRDGLMCKWRHKGPLELYLTILDPETTLLILLPDPPLLKRNVFCHIFCFFSNLKFNISKYFKWYLLDLNDCILISMLTKKKCADSWLTIKK